jgi:hypothetical protein
VLSAYRRVLLDKPAPIGSTYRKQEVSGTQLLYFWAGKWVSFLAEADPTKFSTYNRDAHTGAADRNTDCCDSKE